LGEFDRVLAVGPLQAPRSPAPFRPARHAPAQSRMTTRIRAPHASRAWPGSGAPRARGRPSRPRSLDNARNRVLSGRACTRRFELPNGLGPFVLEPERHADLQVRAGIARIDGQGPAIFPRIAASWRPAARSAEPTLSAAARESGSRCRARSVCAIASGETPLADQRERPAASAPRRSWGSRSRGAPDLPIALVPAPVIVVQDFAEDPVRERQCVVELQRAARGRFRFRDDRRRAAADPRRGTGPASAPAGHARRQISGCWAIASSK